MKLLDPFLPLFIAAQWAIVVAVVLVCVAAALRLCRA